MASFGLRSAVQPLLRPLSGGWPGSLQAGSPSQVRRRGALRELRVLLVAFLHKTVSPGVRRGAEGGRESDLSFLFAAESGELDSLARILPAERIPQLQAGALPRAPRGAAWLLCPGGSGPRSSRLLALGPGPGARPRWNSRGRSRGCAGCVRKGPKSASGGQTGRKFVLPTLCPPGMQAEKEETAEGGQTPTGGGGNAKWLRVWSAQAGDAE
ncbi:uncharacterized protein LOC128314759 [Acinonyx jubatus]|uniref:Uncharacterized protein LOC128314759 n=1 Tax=Acinonyx jubatus TaxID=32536 RepID=A0ABM3PRE7_ACIJB|nr:uncharacterized protein LOC128314759 [Acinonyx jubatus]